MGSHDITLAIGSHLLNSIVTLIPRSREKNRVENIWRNNNELWETVFYKNGDDMADFAPFPRDGAHKGTFCVWELATVWHETKAWERFLKSPRDQAAAPSWLCELYAGAA